MVFIFTFSFKWYNEINTNKKIHEDNHGDIKINKVLGIHSIFIFYVFFFNECN